MSQQYFNGQPIGYKISYSISSLEDSWNSETVSFQVDTIELRNLSAYTEYAVRVSAVSSGGVGPGIQTFATTDQEGERHLFTHAHPCKKQVNQNHSQRTRWVSKRDCRSSVPSFFLSTY